MVLLSAPAHGIQSWLDERLFGWTPSVSSRTGYPSDSDTSRVTSTLPTPDVSDDEMADHDNLLAPSQMLKASSRGSSYADLRLRKASALTSTDPVVATELIPNPTLDADGQPIMPSSTSSALDH
jgi:hypothetical protein